MSGLKNVRRRHTDALTQVRWDRLEAMLADYYRAQGYAVDHCGTGNTRSRFDGGIDLKLRRDGAYLLVQCKHWNAKQVPHNDVHQLIGLMVNEGATGAILVTSGEFTRAAVEAAVKHGHVQLVDGDDLRGMLGPLPDSVAGGWVAPGGAGMPAALAHRAATTVGERLLSALEDRIRHSGGRGRGRRNWGSRLASAGLGWLLWKFIAAAVIALVLGVVLRAVLAPLQPPPRPVVVPQAGGQELLPVPSVQRGRAALPLSASVQPGYGGVVDDDARRPSGVQREQSAAEIRESQRKADEAMRVLAPTTPEM